MVPPAKGDRDSFKKGRAAVWRAQEKSCIPDNLFGHWEIIILPVGPGKSHCPRVAIQKNCVELKTQSGLQEALDLDF